MSLLASLVGQCAQLRVTEVETSSAVGVPGAIRAVGTALAAITNEEWNVGLLAIDGNNDSLATVLGTTLGSLEGKVAHSNQVVGVDVVESLGLDPVAHDRALVLLAKVSTTGLGLLNIVVVGSKALALE